MDIERQLESLWQISVTEILYYDTERNITIKEKIIENV